MKKTTQKTKSNPEEKKNLKRFLKSLSKHLNKEGFGNEYRQCISALDESFHLTFENNNYKEIFLSFGVWIQGTKCSIITKVIMNFIKNEFYLGFIRYEYELEICEPYVSVFDEDGKYIDTLFGEEAFEHFTDKLRDSFNQSENGIVNNSNLKKHKIEDLHVLCAFNKKWIKLNKNHPEFVTQNPLLIDEALDEMKEWKKQFSEKKYEVKIMPLVEFQKLGLAKS